MAADLALTLSTDDYASLHVRVNLGLHFVLRPRTASLFSNDFLDGYVFHLLCPACDERFSLRGQYDERRSIFSCGACEAFYPVAGQPLPWWASPTGLEKVQGLVLTREARSGSWSNLPVSADKLVEELKAFDGYLALEALVMPHFDPLAGRLATVELGDRLEEVFAGWKRASRRRKPELRQADFEELIEALSQ